MIKLHENTYIVLNTEDSRIDIYGDVSIEGEEAKITLSEVCNSQHNDDHVEL